MCFLMSVRSVQHAISHCNFIADWTIVLGKISIAGLALAHGCFNQLIPRTIDDVT